MSYTPEQIRDAGLDDFRRFLFYLWKHLGLPDPTPVQLDIARWLQHGDKRIIVQAFRGVGKSWITAAFVCWLLLNNPNIKIMVVSASQPLADNFSIFVKRLIHSVPILRHLGARDGQRDSNLAFDVGPAEPDPAPSVKSAGLTGQITGSRADIIIADDIEIPKNSYTHMLRERTAELVKEFDAVLKPGGRIVYLGTPQIEASLYKRLEERGYITRIWPAEIPADVERYHGRLAPFVMRAIEAGAKPGTAVDPKRFTTDDLAERRLSYGRAGYALQFMLDTSPSDADKHPLKCRDLIVLDADDTLGHVKLAWSNDPTKCLNDLGCGGLEGDRYFGPAFRSPEMAEYSGTVMYIDPSGRGNDETAYAIVRYLYGWLYLVSAGGFRSGFSEDTLKALAGKAVRYRANRILAEPNYGGGMFAQLLRPVVGRVAADLKGDPITVEDGEWSSNQKELRICDTLEPLMNTHRLVVDRRVIEEDRQTQADSERYSLVYQMTRITRDKGALANEDRLEAVAGACAYWTRQMARDKDAALAQFKDELMEKELTRFMAHVLGRDVSTGPRWFSIP